VCSRRDGWHQPQRSQKPGRLIGVDPMAGAIDLDRLCPGNCSTNAALSAGVT
jgi:hypothetical protein